MLTARAVSPSNRVASLAMKDREALKIEAAPLDPLTAADGFGGFLSTIFVVTAAGAVVFGLLASGSGEPLLLTIIAVLAMLGLFLLFGIAAGHIRIGARVPAGDVLNAASAALPFCTNPTTADAFPPEASARTPSRPPLRQSIVTRGSSFCNSVTCARSTRVLYTSNDWSRFTFCNSVSP